MRCLLSFVVRNDRAPPNFSSAHFEELQLLVNFFYVCVCTMYCVCAGVVVSVYAGSSVSGAIH